MDNYENKPWHERFRATADIRSDLICKKKRRKRSHAVKVSFIEMPALERIGFWVRSPLAFKGEAYAERLFAKQGLSLAMG